MRDERQTKIDERERESVCVVCEHKKEGRESEQSLFSNPQPPTLSDPPSLPSASSHSSGHSLCLVAMLGVLPDFDKQPASSP